MTLIDMSRVTSAMLSTIQQGVSISTAWAPNPAPPVEAIPPESMAGEGLCWFLYAVGENAVVATLPGPPAGKPLGVDMFFQLTAHGAANPPTTVSTQREQLLLGLAMKTLHEHPRLEAGLAVGGLDIFASAGLPSENSLGVELLKLEPDQAVAWWTASPASVRAAAYYRVSVALLQEAPATISGPPVLQPEVFGFAGLAPHIATTRSHHEITRPGSAPVRFVSSPATVEIGGRFEIAGIGFGPTPVVSIRGEGWGAAQQLSGATGRVVDGIDTLEASIDARVGGESVVPGMLRVAVVRHEDKLLSDGSTRRFDHASNDTAVSVLPSIDAINFGIRIRITGGPFQDPRIDPTGVRLLLDADELGLVGGPPGPGEFRVIDRTRFDFSPAAPQTSGAVVRLRVLVNGAENSPYWYVAP